MNVNKLLIVLIIFLSCAILHENAFADRQMTVPVYGQRNSTWSNDQLGTCNPETIGTHGCGIASIAMVLKYYGVSTDPRDMNNWLKQNGGYSSGCLANWSVAAGRSGGAVQWIGSYNYTSIPADLNKIKTELDNGYPVIAEVRLSGYQHFVVITGYSGTTYYINDPWYGDTSTLARYNSNPATAIYGIRIYHGTPAGNTGHASLSQLSVPSTVTIDHNFDISFTLKEIQGASKTYQNVAVAILRSDGSTQFDFAMYSNVTVPANGTWSKTATNLIKSIYAPPGTYRAMVRGKLNDKWFDFDTTGSGTNDKSFSVIAQSSDTTKPTINSFSVNTTSVSLGNSFSISYNVSDSGGSGLKQVELWFANDNSGTPPSFTNVKTNLHSGNGPVSGSFSHTPSSTGTFWYGLHVLDKANNLTSESSARKVTVVPVNNVPTGWLDSATCDNIVGWTRDPDTTNPISVHIYANGPSGQGIYVTSTLANLLRSDLPYNDKYHGFSVPTPSSLKDGQAHQIYVYGIDSSGGTNPLLSGSPKSITCSKQYTLSVNSSGASGVAITSSPTTYSGTTNYSKTSIPSGTSMTLTAPSTSGSTKFSSWTGCNSASGTSCSVTMSSAKTVTANYTTPTYSLTGLTINGPTNVNESSSASYSATAIWSNGSTSTVIPTWSENSSYTTISTAGILTSSAVPSNQTVTVSASYTSGGTTRTDTHTVTVVDVPATLSYSLTVNSVGVSGLTISSSPVTYGGNTDYSKTGIQPGTNITLTAPATSGNLIFNYWSGCSLPSFGPSCTVTMTTDKKVTAVYSTTQTYNMMVYSSGVADVPINCIPTKYGWTTNYMYLGIISGTNITLTAPSRFGGANFNSWTGCTSTSGASCLVTMTGAKNVTVNYTTTTNTKPFPWHLFLPAILPAQHN